MPRPGPSSATSAHALTAVAPPARAPLVVDELGTAGSADALARLNAAMKEVKASAAAPLLRRAVDAVHAEDAAGATKLALQALERDEESGLGWYVLAIAREKAGDFATSITAYEAALRLLPDHAEVANDLGRLAFRMGMRAEAEQFFRHFLARHPDHPEGANNLACALREQARYDEAIAVLKPAILKEPEHGVLWNTMGTILTSQGDYATGKIFFEEALKHAPDFPKARYNLGNCLLMLGDAEGALVCSDAALAGVKAEDEREMMRISRSSILLGLQRLGEGWDEYEARCHPQFAEVTHYLIQRPRWAPGAELAGKTFLVVAEQGLGDEILFANVLPDVIEALGPEGRLILAVEERLVDLFQRSFPQAEVSAHVTYDLSTRPARTAPGVDLAAVDLWTPMASLLREFRRTLDDFPPRVGYLAADPARIAYWRDQVAPLPGRKVGLLWKSMISKDARHRFFAGFEAWGAMLRQPGLTFVNLQYGDCEEELAQAKAEFGVEIWQPPGIDLKRDLDDVAALCCAMDLVVGFSNATFNIAAACGAPSWLITTPGAWPKLGLQDRYAWYPQVRVFALEQFGDWSPVMGRVAEAAGAFGRQTLPGSGGVT
jgi:tetratricopeptide (TPR) repeat protein